MRFKILKQNLP